VGCLLEVGALRHEINPKTKLFCLIGDPIESSLSPAIHNAAFSTAGINAVYLAFKVPSSSPKLLRRVTQGLKEIGCEGFNVTVPHKESIIHLLSTIDPDAKIVGAVNTVIQYRDNGKGEDKRLKSKLVGYNTDVQGFDRCLQEIGVVGRREDPLRHRDGYSIDTAFVLGAGGAARACLVALIKRGIKKIYVANRTYSRAQKVAKEFSRKANLFLMGNTISECTVLPVQLEKSEVSKALRAAKNGNCLAVNATSVGLFSKSFPSEIIKLLLSRTYSIRALVDVNYPKTLDEIDRIRRIGNPNLRVVNGLTMLVEQASLSFELWTGTSAPRDVMFRAALAELEGRK
jgi:shikimate dehydrogenase